MASKIGCSRVEWTTDQESHGAQRFYQELGAPVNTGKLFYSREQNKITSDSP